MGGRLRGKTAFVTGAAQGIGRAIAEAFAREGARVIAADLNPSPSDAAETAMLDVTSDAAVAEAGRRWRDVDVLVNCVGLVAHGTALDCPPAALARSFDVNVLSMHRTIHAFLPGMLERGCGAIINIASVVSVTKAAPDRFAYATTKAAVLGLTKAVARDFIGHGIRCNSISPGTIQSPSLDERMAAQGDPEAARAAFIARQPMGRIGLPDEIAAVAVLLASDEARFMSGSDIIIDGGMSL